MRCMNQPGGGQKQGTPSRSASQQGPRGKEGAQREVGQESRRGKQEGDGAGVARHKHAGHRKWPWGQLGAVLKPTHPCSKF